ncbi:hypothetical protein [Nocardia sp. 348MFTsu5.1]|uniref:hypothetical protein n=1 Tax=Nocardia sp. 348MFTsu5.1 TaxID=1172185 RepID=UPI0003686A26|nr:hypothetical protein [Nocardia sp. 348MFTsu5.1]
MSLRKPIIAAVVAVLIVVVCSVALGAAWQLHARDQQLSDNRAEVARQAGPLVAQLFSSTADPDDRVQARAAVTDEFAQQYAAVLAGEPPAGVSIVWNPVHTGISAVAEDNADAVVSALVTETVPGAEATTVTKVVDVHLERTGGQWKIARADEVL